MFAYLKRASERLFDSFGSDTSVPVFDGALKPNNLLDAAPVLFEHPDLADMVLDSQGHLIVACGKKILKIELGPQHLTSQHMLELPKPIRALCRFGDGLVAATDDGLLFINGKYDGHVISRLNGQSIQCVTALCEGPDSILLITNGSLQTASEDWAKDLLDGGKTGQLLSYDPASGKTHVHAKKLAYAFGVCTDGLRTLISESWAKRVLVWRNGTMESGLNELPGYPSRISKASDGGFWLTLFAPRSQLLEFVLSENEFRTEMMRTVDPKYWIAPALISGKDFLEPLQQGGVRQMGVLKPWAPARSYGLVVKLSSDLVPLYSLHSRVGGVNHGIVTALEFNGSLLALSKGAGRILRIPLANQQSQD